MLTALVMLGNSSKEVADKLTLMNIKGARGLPCRCPIAIYANANKGGVAVSHKNKTLIIEDYHYNFEKNKQLIPIVEFIQDFDNGKYPELISN